jgi:hypothetical protein
MELILKGLTVVWGCAGCLFMILLVVAYPWLIIPLLLVALAARAVN